VVSSEENCGFFAFSCILAVHASDHSDAGFEGGVTPHFIDVGGREYCFFDQPITGGLAVSPGCSLG
jgi:hypothetical protein